MKKLISMMILLSFLIILHQYLTTVDRYVFQFDQVMHHETAVVCILSFVLGLLYSDVTKRLKKLFTFAN